MSKTWSPLQTAIFNLIEDPNGGNAIIEAVAGSGKTTTIVEGAKRALYTSGARAPPNSENSEGSMKYQDIQNEVWRQAIAQENVLGRDGGNWPDLLYVGQEEWALIRANAYQADLQAIGPDSRKYMGFDVIPVDKKNHLRVGTSLPIGGAK